MEKRLTPISKWIHPYKLS